ncbi:MAG: cytochrome c oxidase subunit 3 [Cellvibrionaceae bacterium]
MAESSATPSYFVPDQSKLPIFASIGLFLTVFGAANWLNGSESGPTIFILGAFSMAFVLWSWFATVINENMRGMNSEQLKRSYVWGMGWFIFSEVMFFAAFFGTLFYVRVFAVPWLEVDQILWPGFVAEWPLFVTPDMAANGDAAKFTGPNDIIDPWHLPLYNTIILMASSVTVHIAHVALKNGNRKQFNIWLGLTVALGILFLGFQIEEYYVAYNELGLTLKSGIYGATFFMLTGFHGAHVTMGTIMLLIMLLRSVLKGHFKPDDHFGFEAASWYWHFVDVVWVGLFIFVYVLGS